MIARLHAFSLWLLIALVLSTYLPRSLAAAHASSTLISNARVIDGTGAAARSVSVRIEGARIAAVGDLEARKGESIVDARGLALAPGFIDTHSHHDIGLFEHPDTLAAVSQGITTIVVGQDGASPKSLQAFLSRLEHTPAAVNVASYIGHNIVRTAVMGEDFQRPATPGEIRRMRALVGEGMRAGAFGLSTGLEYDPGIYSTTSELIALAREAAKYGGRYISHIRSEDRRLWQALDEIIEIGREARVPVQVSHMKLAMTDWWGRAPRFLAVMERARADGVEITGDVYPYEYWQSTLTVLFPNRDFTNREAAEFALRSIAPAEGLRLTKFTPAPALAGKTIAEIAAERRADPAVTLMRLIAQSQVRGEEESVIGTSMHPDDVAALIKWPYANICSDGALMDAHPRGAGTFTRVLRQYVRERHVLTLEEAIQKMTAASAAHMGIKDRGVIRPQAFADLVLFDPEIVSDRATIENPSAMSVGIAKVWVNGVLVLDDGRPTGARAGRAIRRD
ncbi:MAG: D-aminoacylase [Gammaproteobacteria bacterium]|nr:D-aminoacylase [Gammaproteobacteria bacterium]